VANAYVPLEQVRSKSHPTLLSIQRRDLESDDVTGLEDPRRQLRVALISMPFVSSVRPSIQLGLLGAIALKAGFATQILHLYLDFAKRIGRPLYEAVAQHRGAQLGEWIFSLAAFQDAAPDPSGRILGQFKDLAEQVTHPLGLDSSVLLDLRLEADAYLSDMIVENTLDLYDVVGFSSTFQQNVASIALAARLKAARPSIVTLFGGANLDGPMGRELISRIACVDYAVSGEGDLIFPEFLRAMTEGREPGEVRGVLSRTSLSGTEDLAIPPPPQSLRLDDLPTPDYTEYFDRCERLGLFSQTDRREAVWIPFESSRGCWWGQKHHCTFCGLNASSMAFRSKSPDRVLDELGELREQTGSLRFEAVDNIIDSRYLRTLLPHLVKQPHTYNLFYETKANLSRADIELLARAGVIRIQPGIESLSSQILALMRKGTTALQNVNLLRWTKYYGIDVAWNLLWGFPGERQENYRMQEEALPLILHLQPPSGALRVWLERFSPLFTDRESFSASRVEPEASYTYVYPADVRLEDIAYFFDYELDDTLPDSVHEQTLGWVHLWQRLWNSDHRPSMLFKAAEGCVEITDERIPGSRHELELSGLPAWLYTVCSDKQRGINALLQERPEASSCEAVEYALRELVDEGLVLQDGDSYLTLAIPR
jgi:ribosomal peptide maturation radical SAM protein 1